MDRPREEAITVTIEAATKIGVGQFTKKYNQQFKITLSKFVACIQNNKNFIFQLIWLYFQIQIKTGSIALKITKNNDERRAYTKSSFGRFLNSAEVIKYI